MSDTTGSLRRKIGGAGDLQSVVRTMKAVAASSIGQYEKSVLALADYYRTVELGLGVCLRGSGPAPLMAPRKRHTAAGAIGASRTCSCRHRFSSVWGISSIEIGLTTAAMSRNPTAAGEASHKPSAEDRGLSGMSVMA